MIIVLFHVLYLVGKYVYQNYRVNRQKAVNDVINSPEEEFEFSDEDYRMLDAEAPHDYVEKALKFFPPAYVQRYVAVSNVLSDPKYQGKLRKIVDFGCSELGFLVYLKNTSGVEEILCVDVDRQVLETYKDKAAPLVSEYLHCRTTPLVIEICEGSVTDNDRKLEKTDAVICIELIEHLYPDTLRDLPYNIFGFIKPKLAIITTPNAEFNVLFPNFSGFRHPDHKFEWTRRQFEEWAENITLRFTDYKVTFHGICKGPEGTEHLGACSQMAIFQRHSEKEPYTIGVEGLFKTVALHEYPFHVDNRSDEQKILDEAAYYIRQLSFQDADMQDEVPLEKLLRMLKAFHVTMDALKTILEEAGWAVMDRDNEPVVLVPQLSTFSDYSVVEETFWGNNGTNDDDDDWNGEPGPPVDFNRSLEEESLEDWNGENWDEEPSIIIPQNNSVVQDHTYLFDGENISSELNCVPENTGSLEVPEKCTEIRHQLQDSIKLPPLNNVDRTSVDDLDESVDHNVPSEVSESAVLSDNLLSMKLEYTKGDSSTDDSSNAQCITTSDTTQRLNRMLDFQAYMSTSRSSTSPEPYLLQTIQMDQLLKDSSMCNQSMSCDHWMLNNTLEQSDILKEDSLKNHLEDSNSLHSIYLNASYKENKDSDSENCDSCCTSTSTRYFNADQIQSVQSCYTLKEDNQLDEQLQLNGSMSLTSITSTCISDTQPQFTSSPKIGTKVNTSSNKRRSSGYSEQVQNTNTLGTVQQFREVEVSSKNSLESTSAASLRSNSDISISTTSTASYAAVRKWYDERDNPMYQTDMVTLNGGSKLADKSSDSTLTDSDASTIPCTLNDEKESTNHDCSNSATQKFTEEQETDISGVLDSLQSLTLRDTKFPLDDQSHTEFINHKNEGKTESKAELPDNTSDSISTSSNAMNVITDINNKSSVDTTESFCKYAKDISDLKDKSLVSSAYNEDTSNVQSTSVLKDEEQVEYNVPNREYKYRDINSSGALDRVENVDAKPHSPEALETPPNSWSPEIMDSGYPYSASAPDMTPEYDLSSIAQDRISDSESPSEAEAPRLEILEVVEVENGDLANNNRDGEGNNMIAAELNDLEDLQPLIDILENDLENENDIYAIENGFPIWLLRILEMANPVDLDIQVHRDHRELRLPADAAGDARYVNAEDDEGFDSSSSEDDSNLENNEMGNDDDSDVNENAIVEDNNENENGSNSDSGSDRVSDRWAAGDT